MFSVSRAMRRHWQGMTGDRSRSVSRGRAIGECRSGDFQFPTARLQSLLHLGLNGEVDADGMDVDKDVTGRVRAHEQGNAHSPQHFLIR